MRPSHKSHFDVASAVSQGQRDYQEDALIADFPIGSDLGFAVLADGMGGHTAGDVASKIVVTEVFSELKLQSGNAEKFETRVREILKNAAVSANECVLGHIRNNPHTRGMGSTLIAPVFIKNSLYWVSVGDSPLFLFRNGTLRQLNEDHSMAPQIDLMVSTGALDADAAMNHPERNCLTSVIIGDEIARVDCPVNPFELEHGDILIVASDGLQFLTDIQISDVLSNNSSKSSSQIAGILLNELDELADPDQDNITFSVIKVHHGERQYLYHDLPDSDAQSATPGTFASDAIRFFRRSSTSRDVTQ